MATGSDLSSLVNLTDNHNADILISGTTKMEKGDLNMIENGIIINNNNNNNTNNSNNNNTVVNDSNILSYKLHTAASTSLSGTADSNQFNSMMMTGRNVLASGGGGITSGQKEIRKSIVIHGRRDSGMMRTPTHTNYRKGLDIVHPKCAETNYATYHNLSAERTLTPSVPHMTTTNIPRTSSIPYPNAINSNEMSANNFNTQHYFDRESSSARSQNVARRNIAASLSSSVNSHDSSLDLKSESDLDSNSAPETTPSSTEPSSLNTSHTSGSSMNTSHTSGSSLNTSHSLETSTSSATSSEGSAQKVEALTFGDPRQRQVFEALTGIQNLRKSGDFSDVLIRLKDKEFRCHRFVLSNCSQFFHDLLTDKNLNGIQDKNIKQDVQDSNHEDDKVLIKDDVPTTQHNNDDGDDDKNVDESNCHDKEIDSNNNIDVNINNVIDDSPDTDSKQRTLRSGNSVVVLKGVEPHIFEKVLDFIYCVFDGVISDSTALDLLLAADTFMLSNLSQTCVTHIADTVSVDNVYDVISLVDSGCSSLSDHKVKLRCHQVLREHFLQLCCKKEFLGLSRTRMISLVADSMLVIRNEIDLIHPLIRWVEVRPAERCADLTLMLQLIRFPLMSIEDMDKLLEMPFLKENSLAKALIEESRTYRVNDFAERMSWPRQNCISRRQFPSRDFILWTADRDKGLHLYSIIDGLHYKVTTFNEATMDKMGFTFDSTSTVCCYGDRLFFTGGEFKTDLAWSIDTGTGEVSVHSKMPRGRKAHSMVVSRGCVYCLGGQDKRGYTVLDSVDAYIINKDLWVKVGHMAVAAYNMTAVVSGGAIYMIGGVDHSGQPLRLVQCFAVLRSGLYSAFKIEISNMPPSLLSPRAVTSGLEGSIYIVCGHGEVYRLDVEKRCLQHIKTLKSLNKNPRFRFGLAHVGGCLVVNGGHQLGQNKHEPVRSVCMDIATKAEVKDYSPLLPADIINTCFYAKLSSGILGYSKLSNPGI